MRRFFGAIKRFFLPGNNATTFMRLLPLLVVAVIVVALFIFGNYVWEGTNTPAFCGLTCHTMPPEYVTQQNSAHANVSCEDCHLGRDSFKVMVFRKIAYSWQTGTATLTGNYTYPIIAKNMRPALDACENCHKPETFNYDKLVEIKHFAEDVKNTLSVTYLSMKIGGGTARQGLGKGIHWHIENPVYFYATDAERQNIPYVVVTNPDGSKTEYMDTESGFDPTTIQADQLQKMDCITCHNRIAHGVSNPQDTVDSLMSRSLVSPMIPDIKAKAAEVISASYATIDAATTAINGLDTFYQTTYPDFYSSNKDLIAQAIQALKDAYAATNFPDQKFDWATHPNNIGHLDSAGCFRCHDGKHLTASGSAVRLECNLCHTVPVVSGPNQASASIQLSSSIEPASHFNTNWINLHNTVFNDSCKGCHTVADAGGTSNTSFCSNSVCHGTEWKFAGFNAPKLRAALADQAKALITPTQIPTATPKPTSSQAAGWNTAPTGTPVPTGQAGNTHVTYVQIGAIFTDKCSGCHGASDAMKNLTLVTYAGVMAGSVDGAVIVPGDPANSLLIKVQSADQPHFGQLSSDELAQVIAWIQAGAPEK